MPETGGHHFLVHRQAKAAMNYQRNAELVAGEVAQIGCLEGVP